MPPGYWEQYFVYGMSNTAIAALGAVIDTSIKLDGDYNFNLWKLCYQATSGNLLFMLKDDTGEYFTNGLSTIRSLASNFIGTPFIFSEPKRFMAGTEVTMSAADLSGFANSLRLAMHGCKLKAGLAPWESASGRMKYYEQIQPFDYVPEPPAGGSLDRRFTVPASGTMSVNILIKNDGPFLVKKLMGSISVPGALLVDIKEGGGAGGGGEDNWTSTSIPFELMFGNGQFPNYMYHYRYVDRLGVITVNLTNTQAVAVTGDVVFHGIKLIGG